MEPSQIQLVFNVVMITGVTSLGGYCYLLKKENSKLAAHRQAPQAGPSLVSEIPAVDIRALASARRETWVQSASPSIPRPE